MISYMFSQDVAHFLRERFAHIAAIGQKALRLTPFRLATRYSGTTVQRQQDAFSARDLSRDTVRTPATGNFSVAFCLPQIIMGGVERSLLIILKELQFQRPDWNICVYSKTKVEDPYFINFFKSTKIKLSDGWKQEKPKELLQKILFRIIDPSRKLLYAYLLKNSLKKHDFLIDFHFGNFATEMKRLSAPKIVWLRCGIVHFNNNYYRILRRIKYYDKIICLSDSFKNDFMEQYPDYADKIVRIYNSINVNEIRAKAETDNSRGKYFVVVSRLDTEKDIETVISAFKIFSKSHSDALLYIAGDGILEEKLKRMAVECPQIKFLGKINEPYTLIKNSIGHILSSYSEGFPNVLLENAALETLSISSSCKSGPKEILMNGAAGILFTPGDIQQLAKIMSDVWNEQIDSANMIKTATKNLDRFSPKYHVKQIINLIDEQFKSRSA